MTLSPEGLIASLSSSAEQFTGYSAGELVGKPITQILADETAFEMPKALDSAKEWGHWEGDVVYCTRSGEPLAARGALASLSGKGRVPDCYLLVSTLNAPSEVKECHNPAVADIAADLRSFAHDFNNPLAVIMGFAQLLVLDPGCRGKIREDVEKLYSELQNVARIVEKLHDYAISLYNKPKTEEIKKQATDSTDYL